MKNLLLCLGLLFMGCTEPTPPHAKKIEKKLEIHGDTRIDPYYWLRERDNSEVISYLHAENDYTESKLKPTQELQKKLFEELKSRIQKKDQSVPYHYNGYYYYTRYEEDSEHPLLCRKQSSLEAKEQIYLDLNQRAKDHQFYQAAGFEVSPDQKILAFAEDTLSRRIYTIHFKDLESGKILDQKIEGVSPSFEWANDNETLFYIKINPQTLLSEKVYRYNLKTQKSELVYHEQDNSFYMGLSKSKDDRFLFIDLNQTVTSEVRYLEADHPLNSFKVFEPRTRGHKYDVAYAGDRFYITSNAQAPNFKLMETPLNQTSEKNWKLVLEHDENRLIEHIEAFKDFLALQVQTDGLSTIQILHRSSNKLENLEFDEFPYSAYISGTPDFDTEWLRFGVESMKTPDTIYDYHYKTKKKKLLKEKQVLGPFNKDNYVTERLEFASHDGTKIPVSIVRHKRTTPSKKTPFLLYAYGSYGHTIPPYFSSNRLSLLDRGFIFAVAHIRGGQIYGRRWYDQGRMLNKKNTFFDFNAVAEGLIQKGYTSPSHLYAMGGSAGGLLMGAIINLRPDLYHGVVAAVPFVDVVTTMLDTSIPLTTNEYDEWGNPNDKKYYDYMKSYSPYDNVEKKDYPNLFVTTGLHDSQVQYWEPAKWVAKLRDLKTDHNLLLLHTDMEAGHGGASGRFKSLMDAARDYAFLFLLENIED